MRKILFIITTCLFLLSFQGIGLSQVVPGEKITKENWQKVKDLLPMSVLEWVKKGDLIMQTGKVEYVWKGGEKFQKASDGNRGRYEVDKNGGFVDKSGKIPDFIYGLPFPEPDCSDPGAGAKVMWNYHYNTFQVSNFYRNFGVAWVARRGFERRIEGILTKMFYDGRHDGPIKNPDNVVSKELNPVISPYDIAGIGTLTWRNKGSKPDTVWAYVPALRRTRKVSAANRSDAWVGSDFCVDDATGYAGQIQSFNWKCIGEMNVMAPFFGSKPLSFEYDEKFKGWAVPKNFPFCKFGYEEKGWQGAPWFPANAIWDIRPVYIVEGNPKDPYYNYGKQIFYVDKESHNIYYKVIFDRSGRYWKTLFEGFGELFVPRTPKDFSIGIEVFEIMVDDRGDRASVGHTTGAQYHSIYNSGLLSEDDFTIKALLKYGK